MLDMGKCIDILVKFKRGVRDFQWERSAEIQDECVWGGSNRDGDKKYLLWRGSLSLAQGHTSVTKCYGCPLQELLSKQQGGTHRPDYLGFSQGKVRGKASYQSPWGRRDRSAVRRAYGNRRNVKEGVNNSSRRIFNDCNP